MSTEQAFRTDAVAVTPLSRQQVDACADVAVQLGIDPWNLCRAGLAIGVDPASLGRAAIAFQGKRW